MRSVAWMRLYYAATLVLALADGLAGANVRAVGFAAWPELRTAYYLACAVCFWVMWYAPAWAAPVTLLESSVNVTALCAAVLFAPYLSSGVGAVGDPTASPPNLTQLALNFGIAGSAGTLAFYQSLWRRPEQRAADVAR